jgi:hypothetical protein
MPSEFIGSLDIGILEQIAFSGSVREDLETPNLSHFLSLFQGKGRRGFEISDFRFQMSGYRPSGRKNVEPGAPNISHFIPLFWVRGAGGFEISDFRCAA